jgi:3-oxoacyl-[acyl-carrier protein] reductase
LKGLPGQTNYSAAKAGIIGGTKALARKLANEILRLTPLPGLRSYRNDPGSGRKNIERNDPVGRFGKAEEVASLVGFLASDKAAYITGEVISINGGLYT